MVTIRNFMKAHSLIIGIGMLTGGAIVLFQVISLLVIYRYLKLDYYLSLVAVSFGAMGWMLNKCRPSSDPAEMPENSTIPSPALPLASGENLLALLTSRQLLILRLLAESKTNKEIASMLFIELSTVKTHVNNIYGKLSVRNRKEVRSKYAEMVQKFPFS